LINVIPFTPEHFEQFELRPESCGEKPREGEKYDFGEHALTILSHDKPIGVVGGYFVTRGVFNAWAMLSEEIRECPTAFSRAIFRLVRNWGDRHGLHRMQFSVRHDFHAALKWAEFLGFVREGLMRRYGPDGSDHFMFSRTY
jgi:hypothetical protein